MRDLNGSGWKRSKSGRKTVNGINAVVVVCYEQSRDLLLPPRPISQCFLVFQFLRLVLLA